MAGWLVGWLAGVWVSKLAGWLVGWLAGVRVKAFGFDKCIRIENLYKHIYIYEKYLKIARKHICLIYYDLNLL